MSCRDAGTQSGAHRATRGSGARARGPRLRKLIGTYRPTDRNKLVVDHYAKLGFSKVAAEESGLTRWELHVQGAEPESAPIKVISQGFATDKGGFTRMTQPNAVDAAHVKKSKLPRRDWILLPILGVATILLLLSASEVVGGYMFTSSMTGSCMVFDDPTTGARGVPNSTCWQEGT